jgi:outer membrane protein TolC
MVKSARRKTAEAVTAAAGRSSKSLQNRSGQPTDRDIARRAYELYEERGREHGHDIDDWLQAERDLRDLTRLHVA